MEKKENKFELELSGKKIEVTSGKLAKQADGAVTYRLGDTIVLVTAVSSDEARKGQSFFPLTVDVEERMYAAGKIPGGFIKREGRPSENSILTARLIDRPLRPSFPKGYLYDTQIVVTILSVDQINPYDVLALNAASTALMISDIPFSGPIGAVRVGRIENEIIVNPTHSQIDESDFNIIVAGNKEGVLMIESSAKEVAEEEVVEALKKAKESINEIISFQEKIIKEVGVEEREYEVEKPSDDIEAKVEKSRNDIAKAIEETDRGKRKDTPKSILEKITEEETKNIDGDEKKEIETGIKEVFKKIDKDEVRKLIVEKNKRPDGRKLDEIRALSAEAGLLPKTRIHGSGLFSRGETQVLTVLTLGTVGEDQMIDGIGLEESKGYMHHYNFPPFSTGETWPMRGPKRREIGHGSLAEKALIPVLPSEEEFPYTIRLVSDVLESNGSTSMASVCGSTLALMDGGVPIKRPIGGIAMGLVKEGDKVAVLTDIQGSEDAYGDMDFKVAGSREGVTAIQMDMKISGINFEILTNALEEAKKARMKILDVIEKDIPKPREELSEYAPRVITLQINKEKIAEVIGPGGKVIKGIIEETEAAIDIEQDGTVFISSKVAEAGNKAKEIIEDIVKVVEPGEKYDGEVIKTLNFGAVVKFSSNKEGLIHISKLGKGYVKNVEDVVKVGDKVKIEVEEVDPQGKVRLKLA